MPRKIEISHRTIIFTVLFLIGLWLLYEIRQIIVALFVSFIFMSALNPAVDRLEKWRFPRWLAILLMYFVIFGVIGIMLAVIITPTVSQTASFINKTAFYLKQLGGFGIDPNIIAGQFAQLGTIPANILKVTIEFFSNLVALLALAVITFYLLLERKNLNRYLLVLFGEGKEKEAELYILKIEKRLGGWVRGELTLMTIVGLMCFVGLRLLGIEFALPLAILAGLLEIIPNIGPIISAIPAVLTGLTISPLMALAVAALYFLIQQLENSIIVPRVMQKVAGVNPLVTILSLAIGFKLAGVTGAILAVPIVLVCQVTASEVFASKRFQTS
ncbi:MAG: AI-2E family transporter [Patescibacteria group bacterium]